MASKRCDASDVTLTLSSQVAHTDVTLDDIWSLDLVKLNGWRIVRENTAGEDAFKDEEGWETDDSANDAMDDEEE